MKKLLLLFFICLPTVCFAEDPTEIVRQVEKKLSPGNFRATFALSNKRLDGTLSNYEIQFQIQDPHHTFGVFVKPENEKGRQILRIGDALWTYMPKVGRSIRIADRDSFAGGDFSNADVLRPDWTAQYSVTVAKETPRQWILDLTAKNNLATYAKMRLWVDKKLVQPIQQNFYDSKGTLLKRARYGAITDYGGVVRPAKVKMVNMLTNQFTELKVLSLIPRQKLSPSRFSVDNLGK